MRRSQKETWKELRMHLLMKLGSNCEENGKELIEVTSIELLKKTRKELERNWVET